MGFDAGDSNLYRYVKNAPPAHTDPSGLQVVPAFARPLVGKTPGNDEITFTFLQARVDQSLPVRGSKGLFSGVSVKIQVEMPKSTYDQIVFIQLVRIVTYLGSNTPVPLDPVSPVRRARSGWGWFGVGWQDLPSAGWFVDSHEQMKSPFYHVGPIGKGATTLGPTKSTIIDTPSINDIIAPGQGMHFITCAIGIKAGKEPEYLGSVRWGYYVWSDGKVEFDPANGPTLDRSVPPELGHALKRWNDIGDNDQISLKGVTIGYPPPPPPPRISQPDWLQALGKGLAFPH